MISTFHEDYLEKFTDISLSINLALPMAQPTTKLTAKLFNTAKSKYIRAAKASIQQIREV